MNKSYISKDLDGNLIIMPPDVDKLVNKKGVVLSYTDEPTKRAFITHIAQIPFEVDEQMFENINVLRNERIRAENQNRTSQFFPNPRSRNDLLNLSNFQQGFLDRFNGVIPLIKGIFAKPEATKNEAYINVGILNESLFNLSFSEINKMTSEILVESASDELSQLTNSTNVYITDNWNIGGVQTISVTSENSLDFFSTEKVTVETMSKLVDDIYSALSASVQNAFDNNTVNEIEQTLVDHKETGLIQDILKALGLSQPPSGTAQLSSFHNDIKNIIKAHFESKRENIVSSVNKTLLLREFKRHFRNAINIHIKGNTSVGKGQVIVVSTKQSTKVVTDVVTSLNIQVDLMRKITINTDVHFDTEIINAANNLAQQFIDKFEKQEKLSDALKALLMPIAIAILGIGGIFAFSSLAKSKNKGDEDDDDDDFDEEHEEKLRQLNALYLKKQQDEQKKQASPFSLASSAPSTSSTPLTPSAPLLTTSPLSSLVEAGFGESNKDEYFEYDQVKGDEEEMDSTVELAGGIKNKDANVQKCLFE